MRNLIKAIKTGKPMMIHPSIAKSQIDRFLALDLDINSKASEISEMLKMMFGEQPKMEIVGKTAIIPVKGVIGRGLSEIEKMCNCVDIDDVSKDIDDAVANPAVEKVLLDFDSPGGGTDGLDELAEKIRTMPKYCESYSSKECLSAAYYLGSQAKKFSITKSAEVGSVGVYMAFPDVSEAYAMEGVKMEVIKSGKYKAIGLDGTSLTDEQRKYLQDDVDETHKQFKETVKSVRKFVKDEDMEGQSFVGKKAAEKGFVTGIVSGMEDVVSTYFV
jgi:signal peptide peptidase SppA